MDKLKANLMVLPQNQESVYSPDSRLISVDSQSLLGCNGKIIIYHHGEQYLLRQTKSGKLILTK